MADARETIRIFKFTMVLLTAKKKHFSSVSQIVLVIQSIFTILKP